MLELWQQGLWLQQISQARGTCCSSSFGRSRFKQSLGWFSLCSTGNVVVQSPGGASVSSHNVWPGTDAFPPKEHVTWERQSPVWGLQ